MGFVFKPFCLFALTVAIVSVGAYVAQGLPCTVPTPPRGSQIIPLVLAAMAVVEACFLYLPVGLAGLHWARKTPSVGKALWIPAAIGMLVYALLAVDDLLHCHPYFSSKYQAMAVDSPLMFFCRYMHQDLTPAQLYAVSCLTLFTPFLACTAATILLHRRIRKHEKA